MARPDELHPRPPEVADLSALADGSLDPSRRQAVEDWIAGSPHLRGLYEREQAAVELLQQAAAERAPARLRMRLEAQRTSRATGLRWKPASAVLMVALAGAVAALVLLLPGGAPSSPSVSLAARLALRGPSGPAPVADPADPKAKLDQRVQGLYFPNWSDTLGWRPVGLRSDLLGGRRALTVYYRRRGMNVAYTIVAAPALAQPSSPVRYTGGLALQTLSVRGRTVVTWRRAGHTCVISAFGVRTRALEQLADWPAARLSD